MKIAAAIKKMTDFYKGNIHDIYHIERGYSHIVEKLTAIGADIRKVEIED